MCANGDFQSAIWGTLELWVRCGKPRVRVLDNGAENDEHRSKSEKCYEIYWELIAADRDLHEIMIGTWVIFKSSRDRNIPLVFAIVGSFTVTSNWWDD